MGRIGYSESRFSRERSSVFQPGIWESNDLWVVIIHIQTSRAGTMDLYARVTSRKYRDVIRHLLYTCRMFGRCEVIHRSQRDIDD